MLTLPTGRPNLDQGLSVVGHLRLETEGVSAVLMGSGEKGLLTAII